jgi:hypothetical protein
VSEDVHNSTTCNLRSSFTLTLRVLCVPTELGTQAYAAAGDYNASVNQLHTAISLNATAANTAGGGSNDKDVGESEAAQVNTLL